MASDDKKTTGTTGEVVEKMRTDYTRDHLSENELARNPIAQLEGWLETAIAAGVPEPHAMALSTVDASGMPSSRIVLLRGFDERGLVFYTNYESDKGRDLAARPKASLLFFWPQLERQVRVQGTVEKVEASQSDAYFRSRPRESRIGAWASPQSRELRSREELEGLVRGVEARYAGAGEVPLPPFWGGYRVQPVAFEFWQGRASRLHDRFRFTREPTGSWRVARLAP